MRNRKSITAAVSSALALILSAIAAALLYGYEKYLPFALIAIVMALPGVINLLLILSSRDIPVREEKEKKSELPDGGKRTVRILRRIRRALVGAVRAAARAFNRTRTAAAAVLIILTVALCVILFAAYFGRVSSVYKLTYLSPVVFAALFVVFIGLEKWCRRNETEDDVYSASVLGNLRTALAAGRLSMALGAIGSVLKLLGVYDIQRLLTVVLAVIFGYMTLFILLSLTVVLVRREFAVSPDLSIPMPLTGKGSRDLSLLGYLEKNTGITMRSLWSLRLVKRLLPYTALLAFFLFWACTGLIQIESGYEGVVYRFGRLCDDTLMPGIHLTLPWPFDRVETYSTESVNRMTVGYISSEDSDNIWTAGHGSSEYKLLLGGGNELVSINLRIEYKISDLHRYLSSSSSPESILRALAYEAVTARTINTDLTSLLSADRTEFASSFADEMTERMETYDLGLDIVSVVLESIHPPIEIASVYQEIVSAGIRAEQYILDAEATAAVTRANAEKDRDTSINSANAEKSTAVAAARSEVSEFIAATKADSTYPDAYRYRKYLDAIGKAYGGARLVIVGEGVDSSKIYFGSVSLTN